MALVALRGRRSKEQCLPLYTAHRPSPKFLSGSNWSGRSLKTRTHKLSSPSTFFARHFLRCSLNFGNWIWVKICTPSKQSSNTSSTICEKLTVEVSRLYFDRRFSVCKDRTNFLEFVYISSDEDCIIKKLSVIDNIINLADQQDNLKKSEG